MPNQYIRSARPAFFPIGPSIAYIPLTRGLFALVCWDDALWLQHFSWHAVPWFKNKWYAVRKHKGRQLAMHTDVLKPSDGFIADHKHSDQTLNNMRFNLRCANELDNARNAQKRCDNTTGFKGATYNKRLGKYIGQLFYQGKGIHLGCFLTAEEAHAAYCAKARELYGEFARFN